MSIKVLKVREPRLDIEPDRTYVASIGGSHVTTKSYTSDTANNSSVIWSVTTPSVRVGMDRRVDIEMVFEISAVNNLGAAVAVANPLTWNNSQAAGLRQYPIHSVIEVINVRLNDQAFSYEPAPVIHALLNYGNDEDDRQYHMGTSPHQPDISPDYVLNAQNVGPRNPFTTYYNSGEEDSRNLKIWTSLGPNQAGLANSVITLKVVESMMMSPFYWGKSDHQALFGIQNFDVTLTLTNLQRVIAGSALGWVNTLAGVFPDNSIVTVNVSDLTKQKIHLTFITPQPDQPIPRLLHYPYYQIRKFQQTSTTPMGFGQTQTVSLNNITLHEIPKRMYIYGKQIPTNNYIIADFYTAIDKIVINFDNQDGRMSTLDAFDLWKLSVKNGLKRSFVSYNKIMGSVLCLEFGTDLNLNPLLCAGVRGNFQFSADVTIRDVRENANLGNINYTVYTLMVPEGVLTVDDQLISISIGTLTEEIVAQAPFAPSGYRQEIQNYYGGGFWKNLWNGIKKVFKVGAPIARDIAGAVGQISSLIPHPAAQGIGIGANAVNKVLGQVTGQGRRRGGAKLRSSSLARRL